MPSRLLLLEDDPAIAHTVVYALVREGFEVTPVALVRDAAQALREPGHGFAAALLDIGLPDGSGLDLCRELRQQQAGLPLLLLSARGEETDRVLGLAVGGLDAVTNDRTVDTDIKTLRAKLREARPELDPIATHRGLGYSLDMAPAAHPR